MNHNSIYRRLFFFMIGVVAVSLIIGAVGYARGKNNEQLATRVRELENQLNAKGVITETAASTSPTDSDTQPVSDSASSPRYGQVTRLAEARRGRTSDRANIEPQKNIALAAPKKTDPSQAINSQSRVPEVIPIGGGSQQTTQTSWTPPATGATPSPTPTPIPTVTIKIQHLGTFTPAVQAGDTALSVLKRAGSQNGFQVRTTQYWFGEFVDCIGDLCFDDRHYWAFYFNGQYSNVGASAQSVVAGDTSEWKWEGF